jgi:peptidoglycan hydrolase-like protein with peptidoglycan-binding domain
LRPSEEVEDEAILADGFVARLADHIFENPAMSGGLFVMALTAAAIVSNAMMMQNGHHPDPLFMTRPGVVARTPVPLPRARVDQPAKLAVPLPAPRQAPPAAVPPAQPVAAVPDQKLIADMQRALAGKRLYRGAADGIAGPHTRAAIAAYEKSAGLPVTGTASADLLARLRAPAKQIAAAKPIPPAGKVAGAAAAPAASPPAAETAIAAAPAAAPLPAPGRQAIEAIAAQPEADPAAGAPPRPAPAIVARQAANPAAVPPAAAPVPPVADAAPDAAPADEAAPSLPEAAEPAPPAAPPPAAAAPVAPAVGVAAAAPLAAAPIADAPPPPVPDPANGDRQRYRKVQNALNQAGYGPLKADGAASEETASAIRRFELDNGLPITGKPSERVTARLVSIGAMDAN